MPAAPARRIAVVVAVVALLCAAPAVATAAAARPGAIDPNASPRAARALAVRFAPLLWLDSQERFAPTTVRDFLAHAALKWARPPGGPAVLARRGTIDPARLGARCAHAPHGCYRRGRTTADQLTRPDGRDAPGFFGPNSSFNFLSSATDPPLYDDVSVTRNQVAITYWAFYAFDQPVAIVTTPNPPPGLDVSKVLGALAHEGDWERVVVVLSPALDPRGVRYYEHDGSRFVPWSKVPQQEGHPVAYVAQGTHASYPAAGETRQCIGTVGCLVDRRDQGRALRAWRRGGLVAVRTQSWFGFGGAWGRVGEISATTGPLGPSRYKR